jgi:two-component system LytT family response regulator
MRALIVDDEPAARRKVARFLSDHADVEIAGEAANGEEAVERIIADRPDIVFLDVQMPGMDGFEVIDAVAAAGALPSIVFTTAHDEYAVRAFEVSALDYLLKPFDRQRFESALERARQRVGTPSAVDAQSQLLQLLEAIRPAGKFVRRLLVAQNGRSVFVPVSDIARFEADRNNVIIHARRGNYEIRATVESLERKLDPEQFVRIHRSHIVNLDAVKEIHPWFHGDYKLVLHDGTELMWSRRYAAKRPDLLASARA